MSQRSRWGIGLGSAVVIVAAVVGLLAWSPWRRDGNPPIVIDAPKVVAEPLPQPGSAAYLEMVEAFYAAVVALDVEAGDQARPLLERATRLVPGEPAAWANLGLLDIRDAKFDPAAEALRRAKDLAPESGAVERLLGLLEIQRGTSSAEAIVHLRRAVELSPDDLRVRYALAKEIEREAGPAGGPEAAAEPLRLMEEILRLQPENLFILLERASLAAKRGDTPALRDSVERIGRLTHDRLPMTQRAYDALKATKADSRDASLRVVALQNTLMQQPAFRQGVAAVLLPTGTVGEPIRQFLKMTPPKSTPAPPDNALTFAVGPLAAGSGDHWDSLSVVRLTAQGSPAVFVANGRELRRADGTGEALPFPGGSAPPSPHGVLALDLNSDYRMDFVLVGSGGLRIFQQKEDGGFSDVGAATKLDAALLGKPVFGAWAADVEMDGDLDVVLGPREGPAVVLRNNRDGTFRPITPFEGATDLRDFAWADLDGDGDPDAASLDARGMIHVYANERAGRFRPLPAPKGLDGTVALTIADLDGGGDLDLLSLGSDGVVRRVAIKGDGQALEVAEVARGTASVGDGARLFAADLDNNGAPDLVASGASGGWIALGDGSGRFRTMAAPANLRVFSVDDLNGDGLLDLAGLDGGGHPARGLGRGTKGYHWQVIRPRATKVVGDGRINSFGVGGEIEVRAGLLVQKQPIAGPVVHLGLGEYTKANAARIVWPNGTNQGEFDVPTDSTVAVEQRLKGSCPFLYAFDGESVKFVTDAIWRSPLGLRINAQDTAGAAQTEDWVKIRGDQLAAKDGKYDLRITAELWETHYWDHFALMVVDHPKGTEVFVDERFAREPPKLAVHATGPLLPVAYARDDPGNDVSEVVRDLDGRYLDTFGRGKYQGVARDHWVEVELGDDVPRDRPLRLVAQGWIHPTDSSINVALGQGKHDPPHGLALEVATAGGGWTVARPDLGFPAGKNKTILVDLDGVFRPGAPRRLRLRTNLEVFWDRLAVAVALPEAPMKTNRRAATSAELRFRGFSRIDQADASSPELPDYGTITGTGQRWRDLIGYYTRFGDVRELLKGIDDRYVIANAGDELALRFDAPSMPEAGWVRDFVLIGDGWNKDGDYNTAFSKTVLPLPSHARPAYDTPPGALEDDPVFRSHPDDWRDYHTRYVTPDEFRAALRPKAAERPRRGTE